jgi:uncharacterized membrane protein
MISALDSIIPKDPKYLSGLTKIFFLLMVALFPFGTIFMFRGLISTEFTWMVTGYLSLIALITVFYLISITETATSLFFTGAVLILATGAEAIGLQTGSPFGERLFYDNLVPFLPGGAPLAIPLFWLIISINSFLICRLLIPKPKNPYIVPFAAAFIILAFDVLLEPFGSFINRYWIWNNNYVPVYNFISWYIIGFMFTFMLEKTTRFIPTGIYHKRIIMPVILLGILVIQMSVINIAHGYWLYSSVGVFAMLAVIRTLKRKYNSSM